MAEKSQACDKTASDDTFKSLVTKVNQEHPNTKIIPYPFNVAKEEETLVLIDELLNAFGRLDVWVSSAGLLGPPSIAETTPADLQRCFEAHSMAPFFALKYAPPAMAKLTEKQSYPNAAPKTQKYGSIVVIGSVASTYGGCWGPCYTVASHAALGVVKAGVAVLKGTGVRINCISPGQIDVGLDLDGSSKASIGLERPGSPQEVARVAGFLASGFSSYVTGANLVVDGGSSQIAAVRDQDIISLVLISAMNPLTIPIGKA
ncbi:3-oxoacyl-(Acyl-carrier-protein) reductase [Colletotrichum higginsianum IMI 349063]|uniref:Peroxisomal trans-2-enoyl-CoA reductase n=1 Tax=Colletotrichum higginsianum (strain IMI 349063) TaxID=759273 RepID=A0A1B7YU63_COLHI|nr:3-oxoacyl-(Acyl-carrier-protein) reductase [Colletotrichum higginsianum IMI 349063]OBR15474.1 3-oxoacyl-(Acyl-carrier-protein) reductase [Colletotrichum higginsianum IMI 349063]GJC92256.1 3-oxoacyl-(acyl-carrier-protein) reductase [Colletotrichum higginsianum]